MKVELSQPPRRRKASKENQAVSKSRSKPAGKMGRIRKLDSKGRERTPTAPLRNISSIALLPFLCLLLRQRQRLRIPGARAEHPDPPPLWQSPANLVRRKPQTRVASLRPKVAPLAQINSNVPLTPPHPKKHWPPLINRQPLNPIVADAPRPPRRNRKQ